MRETVKHTTYLAATTGIISCGVFAAMSTLFGTPAEQLITSVLPVAVACATTNVATFAVDKITTHKNKISSSFLCQERQRTR